MEASNFTPNLTSNKAEAIPDELKYCTLEPIEQRSLANEWLHIYTDGSYLPKNKRIQSGMVLPAVWGLIGHDNKNATNYDGEASAVCEATTQLLAADLVPTKVIFIDFQAAISALNSNTPTDCLNAIQCRTKIVELISYGWTVAIQRVPSPLGIAAMKESSKCQEGRRGVSTGSPLDPQKSKKNIISTYIQTLENVLL
ncbi:reverse transcriptase [Trichonephila clavipes]|nr:reverse transcriptase [Trichonephila clavipes]